MVKYEMQGMSVAEAVQELAEINGIDDPAMIQPGMVLNIPWNMGAVGGDPITGEPITRGLPHGHSTEASIEDAFESMMGQFAEGKTWMKDGVEMCSKDCCGKPVTECKCGPDCPDCNCYEMNKKNESKTEGNKFTKQLKKARDNGDDEIELGGKKIPVTEFVLSLFDRETGQFPKGETAVLTAIEKDYGEQFIEPAKQFIEKINATYEQYVTPDEEIIVDDEPEGTVMEPTIGQEEADLKRLAGI